MRATGRGDDAEGDTLQNAEAGASGRRDTGRDTRRDTGADASETAEAGPNDAGSAASGALTRVLTIVNRKGLHARASAAFVSTVEAHDAHAYVRRDGMEVPGDSIMGLMMLAAAQGEEIEVETSGPAADALMQALESLVAGRFGEPE